MDNSQMNQTPVTGNENYAQPVMYGPEAPEEKKKSHGFGWFFLGLAGGLLVSCLFMTILVVVAAQNGGFGILSSGSTVDVEDVTDDAVLVKIEKIVNILDSYYYADVDTDALIDGMYHGLVEALGDPYSVYYNAEEWAELNDDLSGTYYGIGSYVAIDTETNYTMLTNVISGTPAEEAGLMDGDLLYTVDGVSTYNVDLDTVVSWIKGEAGTSVHLEIVREGAESLLQFDVVRAKVETPTVSYEMLDNNIAYIEISAFDAVTDKQFATAYAEAQADGMQGLIVDLRSNGGGYLDVVVNILRNFMPEGVVVYTIDKYGNREDYNCSGGNAISVPMVVLVNGYTASASEIFTGAVKDYGLATVVGTQTFGKGIVQSLLSLYDGTYLKLTTSRYYTPSGVCIQGVGITPDIEIAYDSKLYLSEGIDNQLQKAIEVMNEKLGIE